MINYSHWRIKEIMRCDYHLKVERIWGYKYRRGLPNAYRLVDKDGNIVVPWVLLNTLRLYLEQEGYPLHDDSDNM